MIPHNNASRSTIKPLWETRYDAGKQLAQKLSPYKQPDMLVLAIPNGGLPLGMQVAVGLGADLDVIISRKLPVPARPEAGFGAVTDDGTVILNRDLVDRFNLDEPTIDKTVVKVKETIQQRIEFYRGDRVLPSIRGRLVVIVDDGLASGYTMLAAIESVRRRHGGPVIVAVPVASAAALDQVKQRAHRVVTCFTGFVDKFYIADYYRYWHDLSDDEGRQCYLEWWRQRGRGEKTL